MMKVAVVGAGPGGLSAALGLLRHGFAVTIFEQRAEWKGRVCGAFLSPESVKSLEWLGVLEEIKRAGAVQIASCSIMIRNKNVGRISFEKMHRKAYGLARKDLEHVLLRKVLSEGGDIKTGYRVAHIEPSDSKLWTVSARGQTRNEIESSLFSLVVLATGRFSKQGRYKSPEGWYGWTTTFRNFKQAEGEVSLNFYPTGYIGVLPFGNGYTNVSGLVLKKKHQTLSWDTIRNMALNEMPHFRDRLNEAQQSEDWHGVGPLPFSYKIELSEKHILVGDAAAVGDPYMGEGIGRALASGPMIYQALQKLKQDDNGNGALIQEYNRMWNSHFRKRMQWGTLLRPFLQHNRTLNSFLTPTLKSKWISASLLDRFHGCPAPLPQ